MDDEESCGDLFEINSIYAGNVGVDQKKAKGARKRGKGAKRAENVGVDQKKGQKKGA